MRAHELPFDFNVTCKQCGWVHFPVTKQYAEEEIARTNEYFSTLTSKEKKQFYGTSKPKLSMASYTRCMLCGNKYTNFRRSVAKDCPDGCTLSPILYFEE